MRFKRPPAAASGQEYATVDARCEACVVKGGHEERCIPEDAPGDWRQAGRPCPRVELPMDLAIEAAVLRFLLHDDLKRMGATYFEAMADVYALDGEERAEALDRIRAALEDEEVIQHLHPPIEQPEK